MHPAPGRSLTWGYRAVVAILHPPMRWLTRRTWSGAENLPATGGFIAVSNHITNLDPLTFGHYLVDHDVPVKFLAKAELFKVPVVGWALRQCRQIPVYRGSTHAADSLVEAERAVEAGECVGIFPEGTLTHDPDEWPMKAYTGVARIALATRAPVIPIAQWGAQRVMPRFEAFPATLRPQSVAVMAMPAVDLRSYYDQPITAALLREVTDVIMRELTAGVAQLRGQEPPAHVWDRKVDGDTRVPHKQARAQRKERERARR